jgi:hypothetical protein
LGGNTAGGTFDLQERGIATAAILKTDVPLFDIAIGADG